MVVWAISYQAWFTGLLCCEVNFIANTMRGASLVRARLPGTWEVSWLDQKAISLLNANLFVCPFFPLLCVCLDCTSGHIMIDYGRRRTLCFLQKWKKKNVMVLGHPAAGGLKLGLQIHPWNRSGTCFWASGVAQPYLFYFSISWLYTCW